MPVLQVFMLAAVAALFTVWIVVGVRMLRLARRTGNFAERVLGLGLLLQAGIGYPLSAVAPYTGGGEAAVGAVASLFSNAGCGMLFVFTAHVFHPRSRWAWVAVGAASALLTVHGLGSGAARMAATTPEAIFASTYLWSPWILALSGAAWGWTGFESLRYYARLRKRAGLGLADPVVANRMLLWGLMGASAVSAVVIDTLLLYLGDALAQRVLLPLVTSVAGLAVSLFLVLAFLPPRAYLDAVKRRAAQA